MNKDKAAKILIEFCFLSFRLLNVTINHLWDSVAKLYSLEFCAYCVRQAVLEAKVSLKSRLTDKPTVGFVPPRLENCSITDQRQTYR